MYIKGLIFAIAAMSFQPVLASDFVEGVHYTELNIPKTKLKEIREYFSFYCRQCYSQESFMKELEQDIPRRASFVKNHVEGIPEQNIEIEKLLTKALIISERMRIKDKVVEAIFNTIHNKNGDFKSADDIKSLFLSFGVSEIMYDSTASSFTVDMKADEMKQKTDALRAQGHSLVPTLIVNGKYKPNTTQLTSMQEYKALVYFLLGK